MSIFVRESELIPKIPKCTSSNHKVGKNNREQTNKTVSSSIECKDKQQLCIAN